MFQLRHTDDDRDNVRASQKERMCGMTSVIKGGSSYVLRDGGSVGKHFCWCMEEDIGRGTNGT